MTAIGWLVLATIAFIFICLIKNWAPADLLFLGAAAFLALCGAVTPEEAFAGFANQGVLTVAILFVVAASMRETGILEHIGHHVLGRARNTQSAMRRLAVVVMPLSAVLNNTPIVAMFLPVVLDWCRKRNRSPSKILIPLSFFAILGGTCTLIGTSTNLVVNGLMVEHEIDGMHLFEIAKIGVPYAVIGFAYLYFFGGKLLPERKEFLEQMRETQREYLAEMEVRPGCRLIGQTVAQAGLRHLSGLFLVEINRGDTVIAPVAPRDRIEEGDRLVFTGVLSGIIEVERIPGLVPADDPTYESASGGDLRKRQMCEAVVSDSSALIDKTIRDADFRATYGAAVIAVHRGGSRIEKKVGDISLRPGDTLLLQVGPHFVRAHRNDPAFFLISEVDDWRPFRRDRAWIALALFSVLLVIMTLNALPTLVVACLTAAAMVGLGCLSAGEARRSVDYRVIVTIACAFGVGKAMENSGAAEAVANAMFQATDGLGPIAALATIYLIGVILTGVITNNAAAVLLFPICITTAELYDASPMPFIMALILSASASFITPIGYQTNMMVYGPGGYRFTDYIRIGAPLNALLWIAAVVLIPWFWPF